MASLDYNKLTVDLKNAMADSMYSPYDGDQDGD